MLICYGMAGQNACAAARLYRDRFPQREHPSKNVIIRLIHRARRSGSLLPDFHRVGGRDCLLLREEDRILRAFEENPQGSVRRTARALGLTRSTVHRMLHRHSLHPYHFRKVQQLSERDYVQRIYFCEGMYLIFIYNIRPDFCI